MAQYFTDFSEYVTGQQPPDWTIRWSTATTALILDDGTATGGKLLKVATTSSSGVHRAATWDTVDGDPDRATLEVLSRWKSDAPDVGNRRCRLLLRGSGALGSHVGYVAGQAGTGPTSPRERTVKYVNGSFTGLTTSTSVSPALNAYYYTRSQVSGTTLRTKTWLASDPEPTAWTITNTDASITAAGWAGLFLYDGNSNSQLDTFSVGTNGDPAPFSTVAASLGRPKGFPEGVSTYSGSAVTRALDGTLYYVVTASATAPTDVQVKAGQDSGGIAAPSAGSQAVTFLDAYTVSGAGLTEASAYYIHFFHESPNGNSQVTTSPVFSTFDSAVTAPSGVPDIESVTDTETAIYFSFKGATGVDGYQYRLDTSEIFDIGLPVTLEHTITDLLAGLIAETPGLELRGYNLGGNTSWSTPQAVYTEGHRKPAPVVASSVVSRTGSQAIVSWEYS